MEMQETVQSWPLHRTYSRGLITPARNPRTLLTLSFHHLNPNPNPDPYHIFNNPNRYPTAQAQGLQGMGGAGGPTFILPVYNQGGAAAAHLGGEHLERLHMTYSLARGVKILCLISTFFLFLNLLLTGLIFYLLLLVGPVVGYYGCKEYKASYIYAYVAYFFMDMIINIFIMAAGAYWFIIFIIFDIIIVRYVLKLIEVLKQCSEEDLNFLRNAQNAPQMHGQQRSYFVAF